MGEATQWASSPPDSAIHGTGFGAGHRWMDKGTEYRITRYVCRDCGLVFHHNYPAIDNIFKALALSGVPDRCSQSGSASSSPTWTPKEMQ